MNASSRDGFVTMVSAFAATVFYGVPLVVAALGSSPWVAGADERAEAPIESGTVRMLLPLLALPVEPEVEEPVEEEVAVEDEPPVDAQEPTEVSASEAEPEGPTIPEAPQGKLISGKGVEGEGTGEASPAPRKPVSAARARRQRNCENPHPNIHPRGGVVEIDRSLVDAYTKNLEAFMSLGYSRPYDENGVRGWYISGFSCTSPVHKAGFRRGDVLLSVNGKNTRSWIGVYMLYQKLKSKDDFDIQVVRKGAPMTLRFHIVNG